MEDASLITQLVQEIEENPEAAIKLLSAMSKVVKPWVETSVGPLDPAVGRGQNVVKAYKRVTVTGEEVAVIHQDFPTWHIRVRGERPVGAPTVFNKKDAEREAKNFADDQLRELGLILMEEEPE